MLFYKTYTYKWNDGLEFLEWASYLKKNDSTSIFAENAHRLEVSVLQVPWKVQRFYVKSSNAFFEEKHQLNDKDSA